ncbi:MAG: hypothetical protein KDE51_16095 [Anaerolineales bacterium]|nr:hypothetical protein [Anaerolineales bacterium]
MSQDLNDIAQKMAAQNSAVAAAQFAQLFSQLLEALPDSRSRAQFILHLRQELGAQGYTLSLNHELVSFQDLEVGEAFATINGRRGRKIADLQQVVHHKTLTYNATELHNPDHYLMIRPHERVHRLEKPKG